MKRLEPGLDKASELRSGSGWAAANISIQDDRPLAITAEVGAKLNQDWAVYGDAWYLPTVHTAGAEIGARWKRNLDLYAGGYTDFGNRYAGEVGVRYHWD